MKVRIHTLSLVNLICALITDYTIVVRILISFDGVVVITSALHAEGRGFDPPSKY